MVAGDSAHEMIISSMLPILIAISSADLVKRPPTLGASAKRWSYLGFRVQGLGFRVQGSGFKHELKEVVVQDLPDVG
jgi:hypothetical protein